MPKRKRQRKANMPECNANEVAKVATENDEHSSGYLDVSDLLEPELPEVAVGAVAWGKWNDAYWPLFIRREADKGRYRCFIFHPNHRDTSLKINKKRFEPLGMHKLDQMCLERSKNAKLYSDVKKSLDLALDFVTRKGDLTDLSAETYLDVCARSAFLEFSEMEFSKLKAERLERRNSTSPEIRKTKYPETKRLLRSLPVSNRLSICDPPEPETCESKAVSTLDHLKQHYAKTYEAVMQLNEAMSRNIRSEKAVCMLKKRILLRRKEDEQTPRETRLRLFLDREDDASFRKLKTPEFSSLGTLALDSHLSYDLYKYLMDQWPWTEDQSYPARRDFIFYVILPEAVNLSIEMVNGIQEEEADKTRIQGLFSVMDCREREKWNREMDEELEADMIEKNGQLRMELLERVKMDMNDE